MNHREIQEIQFFCDWDDIHMKDTEIDVFVRSKDNYNYVLTVGTPKYIEYFMENENKDYFTPGYPLIFVKSLTKENVEQAVKAFAEENDGYWLKVYN